MLAKMQKEALVKLELSDDEPAGIGADAKLVALARTLGVPIMTNDYGLNRVAELQGVTVLNVNDLAKAVRPVVLPGEEITVRVIQEGKEQGQGVGYLEDGTMVVIENGARHVGTELGVNVMRVLQTVGGRMIFAQPKGEPAEGRRPRSREEAPRAREPTKSAPISAVSRSSPGRSLRLSLPAPSRGSSW